MGNLILLLAFVASCLAQVSLTNTSTLTGLSPVIFNATSLSYKIPESQWPVAGNSENKLQTGWLDGTQPLPNYVTFEPRNTTITIQGSAPISGLMWLQFIPPEVTQQVANGNSSVLLIPIQWQNSTPTVPIIRNFNYSTVEQLTYLSPAVTAPGKPLVYQMPVNSYVTTPNMSALTWTTNVKTEWEGQGSGGPVWVRFDSESMQLQGTPPANFFQDPSINQLPTFKTSTQVINGTNQTVASVTQRVQFTTTDPRLARSRFNVPLLVTNGTDVPVPPIPPPTPVPESGGANVGAIVGGVIGGLAAVGLIGGGAYYYTKQKGTKEVPTDYPMEVSKQLETGPSPPSSPPAATIVLPAAAAVGIVAKESIPDVPSKTTLDPMLLSQEVSPVSQVQSTTYSVSPLTPPALAEVSPVESPLTSTITSTVTAPLGTSQLDLGPMESRWNEVVTPKEAPTTEWKRVPNVETVPIVSAPIASIETSEVLDAPVRTVSQSALDQVAMEQVVVEQVAESTPLEPTTLAEPSQILTQQTEEPEEEPVHPAAAATLDLAALPKVDTTPPLSPRPEKGSPRPISYRSKEGTPRPESAAFMASLAIAQMRRTTSVESLSDPRSSLAMQLRGSRTSVDVPASLAPNVTSTPSNAAERAVVTTTEEGLPHVEMECAVGKPFYYMPISLGQGGNCTYSLVPHGDSTFLDSQSVTSTTIGGRTPRWLRVHYRTGAMSGIPYEGDRGETWVDVVRNWKEGPTKREVIESVKINVT
jgi:hypothetical protein